MHNIRKTIWEVFSNFYLDTELDEKDYDYISKILIESKIELEELKAIDLYEVFPTLHMNLLHATGEWSGFESAWLNEKCLNNYEKRISSNSFRLQIDIKNKLCNWMRLDHWKEIEKRIEAITLK
jgi:hypothetical protein